MAGPISNAFALAFVTTFFSFVRLGGMLAGASKSPTESLFDAETWRGVLEAFPEGIAYLGLALLANGALLAAGASQPIFVVAIVYAG